MAGTGSPPGGAPFHDSRPGIPAAWHLLTARLLLFCLLVLAAACHGEGPVDATVVPPRGWLPSGEPIYDVDYKQYSTWSAFVEARPFVNMGQLENWNRNNINVEPGPDGEGSDVPGMWYRFRARPTHCHDQIVGQAQIPLPSGTKRVWAEFDVVFSENWNPRNPNCSSPAPDYKFLLAWFGQAVDCGHGRAELKMGTNGGGVSASAAGFPQCDDVPVHPGGIFVPTGERRYPPETVLNPIADQFYDGEPHRFRVHFGNGGDGLWSVYVEIDGIVTHEYVTATTTQELTLAYLMLGSNRNLGATEEMYVTWQSMTVWAD